MASAPGQEAEDQLRQAGFADGEVAQWRAQRSAELGQAGFAPREIDEYFGQKTPDMSAAHAFFKGNLAAAQAEQVAGPPEAAGPPAPTGPKAATGFLDSLEAGWQMSVSGLIGRGKLPETVLPEDAPMAMRLAASASTFAGDLPAMVGGMIAGGSAGAAAAAPAVVAPGIGEAVIGAGALIGAGGGGMALPAAMRRILVDHYRKGDVSSFQDFWERASGTFLDAAKGFAVGAATAGAGGAAEAVGAGAMTSAASQVATMVTVGKALDGKVPEPQDFLEAGLFVATLHGVTKAAPEITGKLRDIYARTGMKPDEVAMKAAGDQSFAQELLADNKTVPDALAHLDDPKGGGPEPKALPGSPELNQVSPVLDAEKPAGVAAEPLPEPKKAEPAEPPARTEAEQAVLARVGTHTEEKTPLTFDDLYRRLVDELHPLKQATEVLSGGKPLPAEKDPYKLMRLASGSYGKADQFLEHAPFEFDTLENRTDVKPLKSILEPFKEDLDGFRAYALSRRAVEKAAQGVETGISLPDAQDVVKRGEGKYAAAFKEAVKYNDSLTDYLVKSGIVAGDTAESFREMNRDYVPFYRLMEDKASMSPGLNVRNPIKSMKGSDAQIVDPLESMVKNTYLYVTLAERNRALTALVNLAEKNPELGPKFMERVKTPMRPVEVQSEELQKFLDQNGIKGKAKDFSVFRPSVQPLADTEIAVFKDGKRQIYDLAPGLAKALKGLDRESADMFTRFLSYPAQILRSGAVLNPDFLARHAFREQLNAFTLSNNGYMPVIDMVKGLGSILKKDEDYQSWLKAGGANASIQSIDRDYIEENIFKLSKETGLMDSALNIVKSPLQAMRVGMELAGDATRLGEFKRATEAGKSPFDAAFDARRVTLDSQRIGAQTRAVTAVTAFWNAHLQGMDRMAQAFKEDPLGTSAKYAASITLPSVLLWFANHDDPRYKNAPRWEKDLFWLVCTKDHVFRIPKPFEPGIVFGSLPERILDAFYDHKPEAFKGYADAVEQAALPNYLPTFAQAPIEHWANKSFMTGQNIVPNHLKDVQPAFQYNEYTTETGKMVGSLLSRFPGLSESSLTSPAVIENYVRAWSGNLGSYALHLMDQGLQATGVVDPPEKPTPTLSDIPFVKSFVVRYPSAGAAPIQDFYDNYERSLKFHNTVQHLTQVGEMDKALAMLQDPENRDRLMKMDETKAALNKQTQMVHMINNSRGMKPDEKRQMIDGLYSTMIQEAEQANEAFRQVQRQLNSR